MTRRMAGGSLFQQWTLIDLEANDFGVVFSAGGEAVIGQ